MKKSNIFGLLFIILAILLIITGICFNFNQLNYTDLNLIHVILVVLNVLSLIIIVDK